MGAKTFVLEVDVGFISITTLQKKKEKSDIHEWRFMVTRVDGDGGKTS